MPRQHGNCKFRDLWLVDTKFEDLIVKDRADDKVAVSEYAMFARNEQDEHGHLCRIRTHLSFAIITVCLPTFDHVNSFI